MRTVLSVCVVGLLAQATVALAQSVSPADAPHFQARCRQIADQKAQAVFWPRPDIDDANDRVRARGYHDARYDQASGRCYIEVYQHYTEATGRMEVERRQRYDGFSDELLAITNVRSGKISGMVFDRRHRMTSGSNLGWDDASAYIDRLMAEPIRAAEKQTR
jgi:hypothetical protein